MLDSKVLSNLYCINEDQWVDGVSVIQRWVWWFCMCILLTWSNYSLETGSRHINHWRPTTTSTTNMYRQFIISNVSRSLVVFLKARVSPSQKSVRTLVISTYGFISHVLVSSDPQRGHGFVRSVMLTVHFQQNIVFMNEMLLLSIFHCNLSCVHFVPFYTSEVIRFWSRLSWIHSSTLKLVPIKLISTRFESIHFVMQFQSGLNWIANHCGWVHVTQVQYV